MTENEKSLQRQTDIDRIIADYKTRRGILNALTDSSSSRIILAIAITLLFFGVIYLTIFYPVPEKNKSAFDIIVGGLIPTYMLIIKYFFERSKDYSDNKKVEQAERLSETVKKENEIQ